MGRTGVCWDNAVAESFFATYKKELIHTRPWPTIDQLKTATFSWIETYYNRARRHSTLNYPGDSCQDARVATFVDSSVDARLATAVVGGLWPGAFLLVVTVRSWLVRAWISR